MVSFISNTIGPLLNAAISILSDINKVTQAFSDLWQKTVYPVSLDQHARFTGEHVADDVSPRLALSIHNISVLSATLPNPTSLESDHAQPIGWRLRRFRSGVPPDISARSGSSEYRSW